MRTSAVNSFVPALPEALTVTRLPEANFSTRPLIPLISKTSLPVRPSDSAFSPGRNCSGRIPMPTRLER